MPNVLSIPDFNAVRQTEKEKLIRYKVVLSGAYVQAVRGTAVGEVLNLASVAGLFQPGQFWSQKGPITGRVQQGPQGLVGRILPGVDALHPILQLWTNSTTELVAGAYAAGVLADQDIIVEFYGRTFD